jgi:DHA1 family bicyclomycin/chloramphenicol resistance-like MFS transporter
MFLSSENSSTPIASRLIPGWLILLGALTALGPMSIDMYLPALPAIEQDLSAPGTVGLTLAAFFIGMTLGQLFYGPVSDRFGRKPPLYFGLVLYILASIACASANTITELIMLRFLQALGGCAGPVLARAIVRDRCSARESARAFSMLTLVMGLAPILAPVLGGWLLIMMGWRWLFAALAAFGVLCLLCLHWRLAETHQPLPYRQEPLRLGGVLRGYGRLAINPTFLGYTLSGGLVMAGMFAYITGSPYVFIELHHLSPQQYSMVFGANALTFVAASQINAQLLKRIDLTVILRRALWIPPLACAVLLLLSLSVAANWWMLWIGIMLYMLALGFISPNSVAAALATHGQQAGMASALMGSLQFALATLVGAAVGFWHDGSSLPMAAVMTICGVGAWLAHRLLVRGVQPS